MVLRDWMAKIHTSDWTQRQQLHGEWTSADDTYLDAEQEKVEVEAAA